MRRRDFITLVGGAAAWPVAVRAQQREQKRVGVLAHTSEAEYRDRFSLIRDGLAQLGWTEPRNLRIDYRWTDNRLELLEGYARELLGLAPDVIVAEPGPTAEVFQRLTSTIPIVFITATDPVEAGYVQRFAHPGGNMTGFTLFEASLNSKWLQLLKVIAPTVTRVAVLDPGGTPPGLARARQDFTMIEAAAPTFALTPVHALVKTDAADIARVIVAFASEPNGAMIVPPSNSFFRLRATIVKLAEQHRLPAIYSDRIYVDAGGLISYGIDRPDVHRRVPNYIDRILRGAKPSDLPVQAPTKFELVLNLKTAKALGLTIPAILQATADEVIE
jgi:putative ABC transport system substrate-binding protein